MHRIADFGVDRQIAIADIRKRAVMADREKRYDEKKPIYEVEKERRRNKKKGAEHDSSRTIERYGTMGVRIHTAVSVAHRVVVGGFFLFYLEWRSDACPGGPSMEGCRGSG